MRMVRPMIPTREHVRAHIPPKRMFATDCYDREPTYAPNSTQCMFEQSENRAIYAQQKVFSFQPALPSHELPLQTTITSFIFGKLHLVQMTSRPHTTPRTPATNYTLSLQRTRPRIYLRYHSRKMLETACVPVSIPILDGSLTMRDSRVACRR
jgi:hypothetical protein